MEEEFLLIFLSVFDDLSDKFKKSYYNKNNLDYNLTLHFVEKAIISGLKGLNQKMYNFAVQVINRSGKFFVHLKKELLNTFRINQYLSLKLIDQKTIIYIKGQPINQCKFLLMNIEKDKHREYDKINSIDEAEETLDRSMDGKEGIISAETEFWGHCSNIQAWAENNYDTRILHRTIAFPILKRLANVGDRMAKKVYKEEIIRRFQSNYPPVVEFLLNGNYLQIFSKSEISSFIDQVNFNIFLAHPFSKKRELILQLVKLGSKKARPFLKDDILKILTDNHAISPTFYSNRFGIHYPDIPNLDLLNSNEVRDLFEEYSEKIDLLNIDLLTLNIISRFLKMGVKLAKDYFIEGLVRLIQNENLNNLLDIATTQRLKLLSPEIVQKLGEKIDFKGYYTQKPIKTLRLLERFKKTGYLGATDVIRETIISSLKKPSREIINSVLNKTTLRKIGIEDIRFVLEAKDSILVEKLLSFLLSTRKKNLRIKIIDFLHQLNEISPTILSNKIQELISKFDTSSLHKLLTMNIFSFLNQIDKNKAYNCPSSNLRILLVRYQGVEYIIDNKFNLDLKNKGITDLTKVEGLNNLTDLVSLDLRGNNLSTITGIGTLKNLKKLKLQGNPLPSQLLMNLGGLDGNGNALYPQKFVKYSNFPFTN